MSDRERAINIINTLPDAQATAVYSFLCAFVTKEQDYNQDTIDAFLEVEDMESHPENYPGYTDVDKMFEELLA